MLIDKDRAKELFDLYYKNIYHYCYAFTKSAADADDLTQQTFTVMLEKADRLEDNKLNLWLYRVAYYEVCKYLQLKKKTLEHVPYRIDINISENNLVSPFCLDTELDNLLYPDEAIENQKEEILKQLKQKDRQLYQLIFDENKTYKQIADELDTSEKTINVRAYRLRVKLKNILKTTISLILITFYYIFM